MTIRKNTIGELDWGGIINSAITTAGQVYQTSVQQKQQQQAGAYGGFGVPSYGGATSVYPNPYAQQSQLIPGVSNTLLIGGVAVAAFLLLRKKR